MSSTASAAWTRGIGEDLLVRADRRDPDASRPQESIHSCVVRVHITGSTMRADLLPGREVVRDRRVRRERREVQRVPGALSGDIDRTSQPSRVS